MSGGGESWEQREAHLRKEGEAGLRRACEVLALLGVATVRVRYDGSGDEGFVEEVVYEPAPPAGVPDGLGGLVNNFVYAFLPDGWEINAGSYGTITVDVKSAWALHDHHWREDDEWDDDFDEDFDDEWE
jgi:hypothetical protein